MFLGNVIKEQRQKLHLNQQTLADGICTQAVISRIENQNISPSVEVLIQLCQKLSLTLNDLFSEFSKLPSKNLNLDKLNQIDDFIQNQKISEAEQLSDSIDIVNYSINNQAHYHFQLATIDYLQMNLDEAIFQYNLILQSLDHKSNKLWKFLALIGLAMIYQKRTDHDKVKYFIDTAEKIFNSIQAPNDNLYYYYLQAATQMISEMVNNHQFNHALGLIPQLVVSHQGFLPTKYTDQLYYFSAYAKLNNNLGNQPTISHDLAMAIAFADYNQNQTLLDKIDQLMQQNHINQLNIKP